MTIHDFVLLFYCLIIFLSVPVGYRYVSDKTKETGQFLPYLVISLILVLADGIISIFIWTLFSTFMDTFMYIGGILTGMIFTSICGFLLLFVLLLRRRTFLDSFTEKNEKMKEATIENTDETSINLNKNEKK